LITTPGASVSLSPADPTPLRVRTSGATRKRPLATYLGVYGPDAAGNSVPRSSSFDDTVAVPLGLFRVLSDGDISIEPLVDPTLRLHPSDQYHDADPHDAQTDDPDPDDEYSGGPPKEPIAVAACNADSVNGVSAEPAERRRQGCVRPSRGGP
jgi:hypothetical protein